MGSTVLDVNVIDPEELSVATLVELETDISVYSIRVIGWCRFGTLGIMTATGCALERIKSAEVLLTDYIVRGMRYKINRGRIPWVTNEILHCTVNGERLY